MSEDKSRESQYLAQSHRISTDTDWLDHDGIVQSPIAIDDQKRSDTPSRTIIFLALLLTILGFTVQIEAIAYYNDVLGWPKPFLSLYLTHSTLALPWIVHLIYLSQRRSSTLRVWLRRYIEDLSDSAASIEAYTDGHRFSSLQSTILAPTPIAFILGSSFIVSIVLNTSGVSWFMALAYTTPGDLTAIYNCSAFFAAAFSVPLLNQKIGWTTITAVALSIIGTLIIAYGDSGPLEYDATAPRVGTARLFGNIVAAVGAVAFGLYSVVFKRWTSIRQPKHASSSFDLAIAVSGLTGVYTFLLGWIGIIVVHVLGIEPFVLPSAEVSIYLGISILGGAASMTLLLLLVTWLTPVFASVTSVLCVFFVAIGDWLCFGLMPSFATYLGGGLIFVAFGLLAQEGTSL